MKCALPAWFVVQSALLLRDALAAGYWPGFDAVLYAAAAASPNPWAVSLNGVYFAAPPPSLLTALPFGAFPMAGVLMVPICAAAAVWTLHRLELPACWLLWPPVFEAVYIGSTDILIVALLVSRFDALAVPMKVYALVPMILRGRWRAAMVGCAVCLLTVPWWPAFLAALPALPLAEQTRHAASPLEMAAGLVGTLLLPRSAWPWLLVPAVWPAAQGHYACLALPVIARYPLIAAGMALGPYGGVSAFLGGVYERVADRWFRLLPGAARRVVSLRPPALGPDEVTP